MPNKEYWAAHKEHLRECSKNYRATHKVEYATYYKTWRDNRKKQGLCTHCNLPSVEGLTLCLRHLDATRRYLKKYFAIPTIRESHHNYNKQRRLLLKKNNQCMSCGMPLNEESRRGVYCVNCYDRIKSYGSYIKGVK
jgi:hypothetical protein